MAAPSAGARPFDVAVLGATGFTGQFVLKELVSQIKDGARSQSMAYPVRVAAAGRSVAKVKAKLGELGISEGPEDSGAGDAAAVSVGVAEVDVQDPASVSAFASSCRLVLDCVGPFRFYGRPVVAACVESGTDYLDVSGEPEFMERTLSEFGDKAVANGSLIVSACGFDSVPADLGVQASVGALNAGEAPPGSAQAVVSSYLTITAPLGARGHYGTWDSLVHGLASVEELRRLRKSQGQKAGSSKPSPGSGSSQPKGKGKGKGSSQNSILPKWHPALNAWILPFPGADVSVVRRSLAHAKAQAAASPDAASTSSVPGQSGAGLLEVPLLSGAARSLGGDRGVSTALLPAASFESVKYSAFFTVQTAFQAYLFIALGAVLVFFVRFDFGRKLLLKYPEFFSYGIFSRQGPTSEQMEATSFTMRFDAQRVDTTAANKCTMVIHGPEPGYVVTPWILVQCGLTVLSSRSSLPRGGVLTPAVAFAGTDLQQRLQKRGMRFEFSS